MRSTPFAADMIVDNYVKPTKEYLEDLKVTEPEPKMKAQIPKDWERNP